MKDPIEEALGLPFTKEQLIRDVEKLVRKDKMRYAEAIVYICNEHEFDPEDVALLISGPLKEKLKLEAETHNTVKCVKSNTVSLI